MKIKSGFPSSFIGLLISGAIIVAINLGGCSNNEEGNRSSDGNIGNVIHPTRENIPEDSLLSAIISKNNKEESDKFTELKGRLSSPKEIVSIGELEGNENEMFGSIEKILYYEDNIYVLDSRANNIKVFDKSGAFLHAIGRAGKGPGEFGAAEDMFIDVTGKLFVLDRYLKVDIFVFSNTLERFEYEDSFSIKSPAMAFCQLNSNIVIPEQSQNQEDYFSIFDENGTLQTTMGNPYKNDNGLVRSGLSLGPVICSEKEDMILSAFKYFPFIYAYSDKGDRSWISKIEEFDIQKIVEKDQGNTISYTSALNQPYHIFENLVLISPDYAIAQVGNRTRASPYTYTRLDSYLISIQSGEGEYINSELPFISSATDDFLSVIYHEPYPQVEILSY